MSETKFEQYIDQSPRLWQDYLHHPWMDAIHAGTLTLDQFRFFLTQDMPYQTDFLQALLLGASRSDRPADWLWVRDMIAAEADFEESLLAELGSTSSRDRWTAGPAREGYMNHLVRVALEGSPANIAAALLPCAAGFTGAMAEPADVSGHHPLYQRWLRYYERPEQGAVSTRLVDLFESAIAGAPPEEVEHARMIFVRSLNHQIDVFDAAWRVSDDWRPE